MIKILKNLFVVLLFLTGCQHWVKEKESEPELNLPLLLLTFDDFPCSQVYDYPRQKEINKKILNTLDKYHTSAIVFVNAQFIYRDEDAPNRERMLSEWAARGHDIGNHTYSHHALSKISDFQYKIDILKGEPVLRKILWEHGKELKYFRYPFLDYGKDQTQRTTIRQFLQQRGYEICHVTIDSMDWKFNKMHIRGDLQATEKFKEHVSELLDQAADKQSNTILFHVNKLTSETLDDIIQIALKKGFKLNPKPLLNDEKN